MKHRRIIRLFSLILIFSTLFVQININAIEPEKNKKAIYILPGFMGSKLYSDDGNEIFANIDMIKADVLSYILSQEKNSIFLLDENGENPLLFANPEKDFYGVNNTYKSLIDNLKEKFENSEYDIVFYPYNWLMDINITADNLTRDIQAKGYDKVSFVSHSLGGLLYSAYAAKSVENRQKIEKSVLCAVPLYGTYSSIAALEKGSTVELTQALSVIGIPNASGLSEVFLKWVMGVLKNSPSVYQLLPSNEYLSEIPVTFEKNGENKQIQSTADFYEVLAKSKKLNPNLLNEGTRSAKYLQNVIFESDIISMISDVETVLIGSKSIVEESPSTPENVGYKSDNDRNTLSSISYSSMGDGTVLGCSAFALNKEGFCAFPYKDFSSFNYNHTDIIMQKEPIEFICDYLMGISKPTSKSIPLYKNIKYIQGYSDNTFRPDAYITRIEILRALDNLLNLPNTTEKSSFIDVDKNDLELVSKFQECGIINGYSDNTFKGENGITRAEFLKILTISYSIEQNAENFVSFTDISDHWAKDYIISFATNNYIFGYPDNTMRPDNKITRAEAVSIINRVENIKNNYNGEPIFADLQKNHWAYNEIMTVVIN